MSSRIPLPYSPKVLKLFRDPKNLGQMKDANAQALAGSLACGDMIRVYLKVDEKTHTIKKASFESYGCAANIAAASMMTQLITQKTLEEAWKVSWEQLSDELGGLPAVKAHCGILTVGALRRAIRGYLKNRTLPEWLPEKPTMEEKHALEEEKLIDILSRKIKESS